MQLWFNCTYLHFCWDPRRASWAKQTRWQAPRRTHPDPLARRKTCLFIWWDGMWQLSVLWLTPTYICQLRPPGPEVLQRLLPPGKKPSTQIFPATTPSNHWRLGLWVHWVPPVRPSWQNLVAVYQNLLTTHVRQLFCFIGLSVAIQRFNSVLIQETFDFSDSQPDL